MIQSINTTTVGTNTQMIFSPQSIKIGWGGMDWIDLRVGPMEDSCEDGNELPVSLKCWKILE
jgi:hypothetical protein